MKCWCVSFLSQSQRNTHHTILSHSQAFYHQLDSILYLISIQCVYVCFVFVCNMHAYDEYIFTRRRLRCVADMVGYCRRQRRREGAAAAANTVRICGVGVVVLVHLFKSKIRLVYLVG